MTTAREIMKSGVQCVKEEQTILEAARMMRDLDVGSLPICGKDDKLCGIITDRDIVLRCIAEGKDPATMRAKELSGPLYWANASDDIDIVLRSMEEHQIRRLPIIENHKLVGIVSEADLASHLDDRKLATFVEKVYAH